MKHHVPNSANSKYPGNANCQSELIRARTIALINVPLRLEAERPDHSPYVGWLVNSVQYYDVADTL